MPLKYEGLMRGFQLWVNLPAVSKMMAPRYRGITASEIPELRFPNGAVVKVIAGKLNGTQGPVQDLVVPCEYFDISLPPGSRFDHVLEPDFRALSYVFEGSGRFGEPVSDPIEAYQLAHFGRGEVLRTIADNDRMRFILVTGKPLGEPVAWRGPIVMNTEEELRVAYREFDDGTFIKEE